MFYYYFTIVSTYDHFVRAASSEANHGVMFERVLPGVAPPYRVGVDSDPAP
jgi:hypothetical protein